MLTKYLAAASLTLSILVMTGIFAEFDPDSCPPDRPFENCTLSPCDVAEPCDTDESAVCKPDYCGGCVAKFYHSITDEEVHCETDIGLICELKNVTIGCHKDEPGKVMNILSANYGRLSTEVCRHPYDSNLLHNDTNCRAANSTEIVMEWCQGKARCHPIAANEIFGDPCYGTYKYLLIDFTCVDSVSGAPTLKVFGGSVALVLVWSLVFIWQKF